MILKIKLALTVTIILSSTFAGYYLFEPNFVFMSPILNEDFSNEQWDYVFNAIEYQNKNDKLISLLIFLNMGLSLTLVWVRNIFKKAS